MDVPGVVPRYYLRYIHDDEPPRRVIGTAADPRPDCIAQRLSRLARSGCSLTCTTSASVGRIDVRSIPTAGECADVLRLGILDVLGQTLMVQVAGEHPSRVQSLGL
jgi:hypothetical protein